MDSVILSYITLAPRAKPNSVTIKACRTPVTLLNTTTRITSHLYLFISSFLVLKSFPSNIFILLNMFFSETLLAKRGPLAHVWLAANLERKLSRNQFIRANIEESVDAIVGQSEGPFALRLSGQLLLGVVRIYSRKAKYLMDDCNDTFLKLRMAFRPGGTVDMATGGGVGEAANGGGLTLPKANTLLMSNAITDLDLLLPDIPGLDGGSQLVSGLDNQENISPRKTHTSRLEDITLPNYDQSIEVGRGLGDDDEFMNDLGDLELDLNLDVDAEGETANAENGDQSIELGRDRGEAMNDFDGGFNDELDFNLDGGAGDDKEMPSSPDLEHPLTPPAVDMDESINIANLEDDVELGGLRVESEPRVVAPKQSQRKQPGSRQLQARMDTEIELGIRELQENHNNIIRQHPKLSASPTLYALQMMASRASDFAKAAYSPVGLPPSMAKILDPQYVQEAMRRKRRSERCNQTEEEHLTEEHSQDALHSRKSIRLESEPAVVEEHEYDDERYRDRGFVDQVIGQGYDRLEEPLRDGHEGAQMTVIDQEEAGDMPSTLADSAAIQQNSTQTEDEEPVFNCGISKNTLEVARFLRDQFGEDKSQVKFSDLIGDRPGKQVKVKLFFEILVLATKDAIQLDQPTPYGEISIGSKDLLYGQVLTSEIPEARV